MTGYILTCRVYNLELPKAANFRLLSLVALPLLRGEALKTWVNS